MLFFIPPYVHIVDIECPQEICSSTFFMDDFSELFVQHLLFQSKIPDLHNFSGVDETLIS